jgi:hypothetical protein
MTLISFMRARRWAGALADRKLRNDASRQVDRKSLEIAQRAVCQRRLMRGAQDDARCVIGFKRLLPALRAQAPAVAGLQPGEANFRNRRGEIITARF